MKKFIFMVMSFLLCFFLFSVTAFAYDENTDYMALMHECVLSNDYSSGVEYAKLRDAKIDGMCVDAQKISFEDLWYLSKGIYAEAGSYWLSVEWKSAVGEVILNRVASPEFPNTIKEVLFQKGQYSLPTKSPRSFESLQVDKTVCDVALLLLTGDRNLVPSVVFQANFPQGSGTHTTLYDKYLGTTYLCYSNYPNLYIEEEYIYEQHAREYAAEERASALSSFQGGLLSSSEYSEFGGRPKYLYSCLPVLTRRESVDSTSRFFYSRCFYSGGQHIRVSTPF